MGPIVPSPGHPKFGVAITTVGRWEPLRELLGDLAAQSYPPTSVAIAHHDAADPDNGLTELVQSFADVLTIRTVLSPRGISNGRNAAAAACTDDVDWLWFPNDNSRVDPDFLERVSAHCVEPTNVCAVQVVDWEGPRHPLPDPGAPLTRRTVWGAIEAATFYRRDIFFLAGGFNPSLGTGADSPWQSGEGPDLLLRLSELTDIRIAWVGDIRVQAQTEFAHLPPSERRRKQRSYGRGHGHVLRDWHYPFWYKAAHLAGAALMPLRNPKKFGPREALALLIGRSEGLLGRTFSGESSNKAILR